MSTLIILVVTTLVLALLGRLGVAPLRSWHVALRGGVAAMFAVTAVTHFVVLRADLIAMVPPALPRPDLLVTATGVLEAAGALGLLHRRTAPWAAGGLSLLLVAMLPANIYAALEGLTLGGDPVTPLVPRILLQVLYLAATLTILVRTRRLPAPERTPQPA